ncbi:MAG: CarD family transcriptional regulator [Lachnospiraceae bacterium]|nr:CarD family transcriptional regulator [Lachnospiraceae bacterium]
MFDKGDYVVYGGDGVFRVEEIGPLDISGIPATQMFYTLKPISGRDSTVFSPIENEGSTIRPVMSKEDAKKLIDSIEEIELLEIPDDKKREIVFKESLRKYDNFELIRIMKTLIRRRDEKLAAGKKVTALDEKYYHIAEERLYGELTVALNMERGDVVKVVGDRIEGR